MYNPIQKKDTLVLGSGIDIIVTGWTPCEVVVKRLNERQINFACVGNLYNAYYGITPIVINLLANPYPYRVHILSATRQDKVARSGEALYNLLQGNYVARKGDWQILSEHKEVIGSLHSAISAEDLQSLDNEVYLWDSLEKMCWCEELEGDLRPRLLARRKPKVYAISDEVLPTAPAKYVGHSVEADTIEEAWIQLLHRIRRNGVHIYSRQELLNVTSVIHNQPLDIDPPDWAPVSREGLSKYYDDVLTADPESSVAYTYGNRLRLVETVSNLDVTAQQYMDQVEETAVKLALDPNTTRALMTTWEPPKDMHSEQPPCLNTVFCRIQAQQLHVTVTFRSHDMFGAYYSNLCAVRKLQQVLVDRVNELAPLTPVDCGSLTCISHSAHIYHWSFNAADRVISQHYNRKEKYEDPVGNFVISLVPYNGVNTVEVVHLSSLGKVVKVYRYSCVSVLKIVRELAADNPSIRPTHLAYLGVELQKLKDCLSRNQRYSQDSP